MVELASKSMVFIKQNLLHCLMVYGSSVALTTNYDNVSTHQFVSIERWRWTEKYSSFFFTIADSNIVQHELVQMIANKWCYLSFNLYKSKSIVPKAIIRFVLYIFKGVKSCWITLNILLLNEAQVGTNHSWKINSTFWQIDL